MSTTDSQSTLRVGKSCSLRISAERKTLDAELYKLGTTIRHLQPPGGKESGIFDAFRLPTAEKSRPARKVKNSPGGNSFGIFDAYSLPPEEMSTPVRKVKNHFKSEVFSSPLMSPPRPVTPMQLTSHYKLFEMSPPESKAKKESKTTKSSAFDVDDSIMLPRYYVKKNPITGLESKGKDVEKRRIRKEIRNPITFEGVMEKRLSCRCLQPPGGISSISLEYVE